MGPWARSLIVCVLWTLATGGTAFGTEGEYEATIGLGGKLLEGTYPISIALGSGTRTGSVALALAPDGKLAGTLDVAGRSLSVSGTYRGNAKRHTVRFTGGAGNRKVTFSGELDGESFVGRFADRGWLQRGRFAASVDASAAEAIRASFHIITTVKRGARRRTTGFAEVGERTIALDGWHRGDASPRLKSTGNGFRFVAAGSIAGASYNLRSWKCRTHGAVVKGKAGAMAFDDTPPDVVLITVSGHPLAGPAKPYLGDAVGPYLTQGMARLGLEVRELDFTDSLGAQFDDGYRGLVNELEWIREHWFEGSLQPPTVVMVTHGHGGVRGHGAIRAVPDLPIAVLIDLDASSCDWNDHGGKETDILGGDPVDAYSVEDAGFDLEDVTFDNVLLGMEVLTPDLCPDTQERYDNSFNTRFDGSWDGLYRYETTDGRAQVLDVAGDAMPVVYHWLRFALTEEL